MKKPERYCSGFARRRLLSSGDDNAVGRHGGTSAYLVDAGCSELHGPPTGWVPAVRRVHLDDEPLAYTAAAHEAVVLVHDVQGAGIPASGEHDREGPRTREVDDLQGRVLEVDGSHGVRDGRHARRSGHGQGSLLPLDLRGDRDEGEENQEALHALSDLKVRCCGYRRGCL